MKTVDTKDYPTNKLFGMHLPGYLEECADRDDITTDDDASVYDNDDSLYDGDDSIYDGDDSVSDDDGLTDDEIVKLKREEDVELYYKTLLELVKSGKQVFLLGVI